MCVYADTGILLGKIKTQESKYRTETTRIIERIK
jgi:hypothetical protein